MTDVKPNGHDGTEQPGICIDFGDYLLKINAGAIWLENADGEAMHVNNEDFRNLLDQLFKEKF